jgi:hypothetical protein
MSRQYDRVGPVTCPVCRKTINRLADLAAHLVARHPGLSVRDRSILRDEARRAVGWWGNRPT